MQRFYRVVGEQNVPLRIGNDDTIGRLFKRLDIQLKSLAVAFFRLKPLSPCIILEQEKNCNQQKLKIADVGPPGCPERGKNLDCNRGTGIIPNLIIVRTNHFKQIFTGI